MFVRRKIKMINISSGDMTFGQRIDIGKIFASNDDTYIKAIKAIKVLHGIDVTVGWVNKHSDYLKSIIEGISNWVKIESDMLKYDPSPDEIRAGIRDLSKKIGDFGTVKSLAAKYGQDPDTILNWKYSKVFGILYTDLEEYKYSRRYTKQLNGNS